MARLRPRSISALLTQASITLFVLLTAGLTAAGATAYRVVTGWETGLTSRIEHALPELLHQQADGARETLEQRAYSAEVAAMLRTPNSPEAHRRFDEEERHFLARRGYDFLVLADAARRISFSWTGDGSAIPAPVLPRALFDRLDSAGAVGGYLRIGSKVMLVGGTTLRSSRGRDVGGYLLLGEPVDSAFFERLDLGVARLSVRYDTMSTRRIEQVAGGDSLMVRLPVRDLFGAPMAVVDAAFDRSAQHRHIQWGVAIFLLLLAAGTLAIMLAWSAGQRLLVAPLRATVQDVAAMRDTRRDVRELSVDLPIVEWEVLRAAFNETVRSLSEFQRRYRDVFDRAADALFLLEPESGRVVDANPATTTLTGVPAAQLIGQPLPADLAPNGAGPRVVRWRRADGVTQTWEVATSEIAFSGGHLTLAAYRDLTGREALSHVHKMEAVGSLAGGIAHDFNNLMGAVLTGVTAARAIAGAGHPVREALDGIEHAGMRAAELTRQLLRFSRHDPLRLEPVDLGRAIDTVGSICARTFDRRIVIDASAATDLPCILGDAGEIEQALLNLCINARDAMPDGGSLRVEARRVFLDAAQARNANVAQPGTFAEVTVSDSGAGMTDEVKAHLFEPFFTTKAPGKGTGLGLPLVYGLTRQLGGAITVRSAVGKGTTVRLLFPALTEPANRTAASAAPAAVALRPTPAGTDRPHVLLIEDERALREMLRMVLDLSGFTVVEADDGASGLAQFRAHQAQVRAIVLDVQLPGEWNGVDTLERIRTLAPDVPVLLCTGFLRDDDQARLRALAVDDVLLKPVDLHALITRLDARCRPVAAPAT